MKKRDYELVKDGKFNMRAIMQRAWIYVRNYGYSLKAALKSAWIDARVKFEDMNKAISINPNRKLTDFCGSINSTVYHELTR